MSEKNLEVSPIKHIPPLVGEYAYYDSRLNPNDNSIIDLNTWKHWLVTCQDQDAKVGCNYSMPQKVAEQDHITCHGIIKTVYKHNHEA